MKHETLQLTGANFKGTRRERDFHPTPAPVTIALLNFLDLPPDSVIWDPACGNLAMISVFKERGYKTVASDIVYGEDFLKESRVADAIITNPPFCLAEEFIRKAVKDAPIVCMLLKSQYWHSKTRRSLFFECRPAFVLPLTWRPDFLEHERAAGSKKGSPVMEVAWSVWMGTSRLATQYYPLAKPEIIKSK